MDHFSRDHTYGLSWSRGLCLCRFYVDQYFLDIVLEVHVRIWYMLSFLDNQSP